MFATIRHAFPLALATAGTYLLYITGRDLWVGLALIVSTAIYFAVRVAQAHGLGPTE